MTGKQRKTRKNKENQGKTWEKRGKRGQTPKNRENQKKR